LPELGLSFGRVAALYHRVRPDYLPEALDRAQQVLELDASAEVLDLAAGTGRLTHELARRFARVIAVEPDDAMRALISDGEVLAGTAEAVPLGDASVDAVFVGEAIHWFDARRAVPEMARVLRPRGGFARLSNQWWEPRPPLPRPAPAPSPPPRPLAAVVPAPAAIPAPMPPLPAPAPPKAPAPVVPAAPTVAAAPAPRPAPMPLAPLPAPVVLAAAVPLTLAAPKPPIVPVPTVADPNAELPLPLP